MRKFSHIRLVSLKVDSYKKIKFLLENIHLFGVLPLKVSEIEEVSPGKWEIELFLVSFLEEKELYKLISIMLNKGGEEDESFICN
ncbi:MAG: hypothetical protein N3C62_05315 [Synergistetes bacterium]|nr:hypothetical protein [Synergistota bacterium]MCX8128133.1 hypothetical protein [Synergistota bacterium]MDW8192509.1 hypothetical protein [Synergistota bacterium]